MSAAACVHAAILSSISISTSANLAGTPIGVRIVTAQPVSRSLQSVCESDDHPIRNRSMANSSRVSPDVSGIDKGQVLLLCEIPPLHRSLFCVAAHYTPSSLDCGTASSVSCAGSIDVFNYANEGSVNGRIQGGHLRAVIKNQNDTSKL